VAGTTKGIEKMRMEYEKKPCLQCNKNLLKNRAMKRRDCW